MKCAMIQPARCANCEECVAGTTCSADAIFREQPDERPWIDFRRCMGCLRCREVCPGGAIEAITHPGGGKGLPGW